MVYLDIKVVHEDESWRTTGTVFSSELSGLLEMSRER